MTTESSGNSRPMTRGEYRVGVTFNPSNNPKVDDLKRKAAAFIDAALAVQDEANENEFAEAADLADLAAREAESAAMWAVKAVTKGPQP